MRSCASNLPLGGKWKLGRASERMSESEERRVGDVTGTNVKRKRRLALFHVEQGRAGRDHRVKECRKNVSSSVRSLATLFMRKRDC